MNIDLTEIALLSHDALYFFDSLIYNLNLTVVKKHKVNHDKISANRHLTNFFPHAMPLYPSYIYPNRIIDCYYDFLVDKTNIGRYGKYNDTAAIAALINKFNLKLRPLKCINYLYVTHSGQDSSVTNVRNKINLFIYLQSMSCYQFDEYYSALISLISDISKSIVLAFLSKTFKK